MPPKEKKQRLGDSTRLSKQHPQAHTPPQPSASKALLNFDSDSDGGGGGEEVELKINAEYAKRFEHNKKREELHRLEEKYKKRKRHGSDSDTDSSGLSNDDDDDDDASTSESEDEFGEFADEVADADILATIKAIRTKDPRIYDGQTRFFKSSSGEDAEDDEDAEGNMKKKKEKPMFLKDYHRENLLKSGSAAIEEDDDEKQNEDKKPRTYFQQQDALKRDLVMDMHRAAEGLVRNGGDNNGDDDEDDDSDGFLTMKKVDKPSKMPPPPAPESADPNDPDLYLTSFLASKAWLPKDRTKVYGPAMQSDDSEEEDIIDKFEEGFNLRFEDPAKAAQLVGHARGAVRMMTTRRTEMSARKRARELKKQKKEEERREREIEKGRLRALKVEELMGKVKKIKEAAGMEGDEEADVADWKKLVDGGFNDEKWNEEMQRKFGESYYQAEGRMKKPTWDDDIDIADIVPDFDDGTAELDDGADDNGDDAAEADIGVSFSKPKRKTRKDYEREKREKKQQGKKTRKEIEEYVDENFDFEDRLSGGKSGVGFRYREVTPETFGLTPLDILAADDSHLNEYVGLKKYATFREKERKKLDKKKYSKKRRLREWRKEVFGDENGPLLPLFDSKEAESIEKKIEDAGEGIAAGGEAKKKRKRRRK